VNEIASWAETPAALLSSGGYFPEDRAVELAAREAERARDRAAFEARLASNPEWSAARKLQRHWPPAAGRVSGSKSGTRARPSWSRCLQRSRRRRPGGHVRRRRPRRPGAEQRYRPADRGARAAAVRGGAAQAGGREPAPSPRCGGVVKQRPESGVEYAANPTEEYRVHCSLEAVRSLAKSWGVSETRAADLLADPAEYGAEYRSRRRMTGPEARRALERRYPAP
jgi:hypothetical protein